MITHLLVELWNIYSRSSRPEVFCKKGVVRNFTKFIGKHLCQSLTPATLLKKRLWHRCFPVNFAKFLRTPFFIDNPQWLLLLFIKPSASVKKIGGRKRPAIVRTLNISKEQINDSKNLTQTNKISTIPEKREGKNNK